MRGRGFSSSSSLSVGEEVGVGGDAVREALVTIFLL